VPACGYDSTVSIAGIPNTIMTGTVTTLDTVNLAIYTTDKSLAKPYIVILTTTPIYPVIPTSILPVYSYSTI
jgi:hypothetical protein